MTSGLSGRLRSLEGVLLGLGLVLLLCFGLDRGSLVNSDDPIYASMAREMVRTGAWLSPTWQGTVLFEKPPLHLWLTGLFGSVGDFGDASVRLTDALASCASLLLAWAFARRRLKLRWLAWWPAMMCLGSGIFFFNARRVMTDPLLLAFSLWLLFEITKEKPGWRTGLRAGLAAGLALMTKWLAAGPVLLAVALWWFLSRRFKNTGRGFHPVALGTALLVFLPWHLVQTFRFGGEFWGTYLGYHAVQRVSSPLVGASGPAFYLERILEVDGLLCLALLLVAALSGLAILGRRDWRRGPLGPVALFFLVQAVMIHLSGTRLPHYAVPLYPLGGLLLAGGMGWLFRRGMDGLPGFRLYLEHQWARLAAFGLAVLLFGAVFAGNNRHHLFSSEYTPGLRGVAEQLSLDDGGVLVYDTYLPAAGWYLERPLRFLAKDEELCRVLSSIDMLTRADTVRCRAGLEASVMDDVALVIAHRERGPELVEELLAMGRDEVRLAGAGGYVLALTSE